MPDRWTIYVCPCGNSFDATPFDCQCGPGREVEVCLVTELEAAREAPAYGRLKAAEERVRALEGELRLGREWTQELEDLVDLKPEPGPDTPIEQRQKIVRKGRAMSGPSDKAVDEAVRVLSVDRSDDGPLRDEYAFGYGRDALEAAHDPSLGLDRSVCLRDVVDALRAENPVTSEVAGPHGAADFIESRFLKIGSNCHGTRRSRVNRA